VKIHEYQAKAILARHGIPVPPGGVAATAAEAAELARRLGGGTVVVKAQIHAGGRGKGGGVKLASSPEEAERIAGAMIGMRLVTHQTGPEGRIVSTVLVESALPIARELYVGLVIDRAAKRVVVIASPDGGVEIETVAANTPERIFRQYVHPGAGFIPFQGRSLAFALGLQGGAIQKAATLVANLHEVFWATDASLVEINPLVLTRSGDLLALDAKMTLDDSALARHPDLRDLRDLREEEPLEIDASRSSLNYIRLAGTIGCMVNGAGLAMATMDIVKLAGGEPANFLDVGGGASPEQIQHAFRILLSDKNVRAVLINIFGGILRCDLLAQGLIAAVKAQQIGVPIVIRLEGTNVEEGRRLLRESGLNFTTADSMGEAAREAVRLGGVAAEGTK
jgi:succinyl-CoA synthetase beta subunit